MSFEFKKLSIEDVILITPEVFCDERGFFLETYKQSEFHKNSITDNFIQDNYSKSTFNVLRGLHYQIKPYEQSKLVRCIEGRIFDVAVDIRKSSKTFGRWCAAVLDNENKQMLYIPKGFAHGFLTLSQNAKVVYKVSQEHCPASERGILWSDRQININWNLNSNPVLSAKDKLLPSLCDIKEEELL